MAPVVEFGHPTSARAGNTWAWRISFADYPASESWVLSYALVSLSSLTQAPLTWDAAYVTNDGNEYAVTIPTSITDDFTAGSYRLTAFVTLAGARYSPYSAGLLIEPNTATQAAGAALQHAEKQLAVIESEIVARVTGTGSGHESYQIGTRAINKLSLAELRKYRGALKAEVQRLRGGGFGTEIHMIFPAPCGADPQWQ